MAAEPSANMDGLPTKALSHVATYLPKTERALFAVALTAPSPSWERCGWTDVALSRASRIVMDGPYYGPCASNEYETDAGERAAAIQKSKACLQQNLAELNRIVQDMEPNVDASPEQEHQLTESLRHMNAEAMILYRLWGEMLRLETDADEKASIRDQIDQAKEEYAQICSFVGECINVDDGAASLESSSRSYEYEEKWEVLNFMDVEERVRLKLTDGDVGGVLVCIGALTTLRILRLPHCISALGYGLAPLCHSAVLEKIDLSSASMLTGDVVATILGSIVGGEKHSLNHINLPDAWCDDDCGPSLSEEVAQFVHDHSIAADTELKIETASCSRRGGADDLGSFFEAGRLRGDVSPDTFLEALWSMMPDPSSMKLLITDLAIDICEDYVVQFWLWCIANCATSSDKEFTELVAWEAMRSGRIALLIATNLLRAGEDKKVVGLLLYTAFVDEVWLRGPKCVAELTAATETPSVASLGEYFPEFRRALAHTSSRAGILTFLKESAHKLILEEEKAIFAAMIDQLEPHSAALHSLPRISEEICSSIFSVVISDMDSGRRLSFPVHLDATFSWFLHLQSIRDNCFIPGWRPPEFTPSPTYLRAVHKGRTLFLSSSGKRTLGELGIGEGDEIVVGGVESKQESVSSTQPKAKPKHSKKTKKKNRSKQKKRSKPLPALTLTDEQLMEQYRQQHSQTMTPVFEELGPQLKVIRAQLNALTIHKLPPKVRKPKAKKRSEPEVEPSLPADDGGKAGRVAYPVLVGEVSNLYKTTKTLPRAPITIDLHGNTADEALQLLNKSLPLWVDTAMKGEYPWVIPVDIICGGGSQLLSEAVQGWIRSQRQVANRPKGYF